jgi:putative methyltransferase (TIGR04325 family)
MNRVTSPNESKTSRRTVGTLATALLPPILQRSARRLLPSPVTEGITFTGDYASWDAAQKCSTGYGTDVILERTCSSLLKVKRGEAAYERDSVAFPEMTLQYPLLTGLLRAAVEADKRLSVLDFGGALGCTFYQCRAFLSPVSELEWSVVEQPAHVDCGRLHFQSEILQFYTSVQECRRVRNPNVLLLSGVLQCLPHPYGLLDDLLQHGYKYIILDRTTFIDGDRERLTIQHVPASIYAASIPAWFFSERRLLREFAKQYEVLASFPALDTPTLAGAYAKGFVFRAR